MIKQAVMLIKFQELILLDHNLCENIEMFENEIRVYFIGEALKRWFSTLNDHEQIMNFINKISFLTFSTLVDDEKFNPRYFLENNDALTAIAIFNVSS